MPMFLELTIICYFIIQTKWVIQQDNCCAWWACTRTTACQEHIYQRCRFCLTPLNIYRPQTRFQHARICRPWIIFPRRSVSVIWCKSHVCYHYPSFILRRHDSVNSKFKFRRCNIEDYHETVNPN